MILQETLERRDVLHEDADQSKVLVQAWIGKDVSASTPAWSFQQAGDLGDLAEEETFYRVTEYSHADLSPTYTFYDLFRGRKVYTSTSDRLFDVYVPNTGSRFIRYVAYAGSGSIDPPQECAKDKSVVGVLQYGSEDHVQERILVRATNPKAGIDGNTNIATIAGRYPVKAAGDGPHSLGLWHADGMASPSALSHFTLHITFPTGHAFIDLPVENDRIDWSRVSHSPDLRVQEVR